VSQTFPDWRFPGCRPLPRWLKLPTYLPQESKYRDGSDEDDSGQDENHQLAESFTGFLRTNRSDGRRCGAIVAMAACGADRCPLFDATITYGANDNDHGQESVPRGPGSCQGRYCSSQKARHLLFPGVIRPFCVPALASSVPVYTELGQCLLEVGHVCVCHRPFAEVRRTDYLSERGRGLPVARASPYPIP
jgi:hypothetical protein